MPIFQEEGFSGLGQQQQKGDALKEYVRVFPPPKLIVFFTTDSEPRSMDLTEMAQLVGNHVLTPTPDNCLIFLHREAIITLLFALRARH